MQGLLKDLLTELHSRYFKPNGFKKTRHRFSREVDGVMQEVEFQSSQWNMKGDAITFYVNIHIGFVDIPMAKGRPALTGMARIGGLVPGIPAQYDLTMTNITTIRDELIDCLPRAMSELPRHYEDVRERAMKGWHTPIPLPETWRAEQPHAPDAKGTDDA